MFVIAAQMIHKMDLDLKEINWYLSSILSSFHPNQDIASYYYIITTTKEAIFYDFPPQDKV
tara:strand:- start:131 stop:313 length:183 start_codon:yes stop_codon:yes gene_type:complete